MQTVTERLQGVARVGESVTSPWHQDEIRHAQSRVPCGLLILRERERERKREREREREKERREQRLGKLTGAVVIIRPSGSI